MSPRSKKPVVKPDGSNARKSRKLKPFPASSFQDALVIANAIQKFAAGTKIRRLTLFEHMGKSPDSGPSRQLVTNSSKYGLTKGSYTADHLELTEDGAIASNPESPPDKYIRVRFRLAIEKIEPFLKLYDAYKGNKLPSHEVMKDYLLEQGVSDDDVSECVDTFIVNVKFLGLLKTFSGAERLLTLEHVLEELPPNIDLPASEFSRESSTESEKLRDDVDWSKTCFYISPIGDDASEERMHSDLFLNNIVEPALRDTELRIVRADQIGEPGMITRQIIEYVIRSRLAIVDLSYSNPNVFYELSLRHACRLPTVQIKRKFDKIPFDLKEFRTIEIDTESIYTLVPKLDTIKSEIASQARAALKDELPDNPISTYCPKLKVTLDQ